MFTREMNPSGTLKISDQHARAISKAMPNTRADLWRRLIFYKIYGWVGRGKKAENKMLTQSQRKLLHLYQGRDGQLDYHGLSLLLHTIVPSSLCYRGRDYRRSLQSSFLSVLPPYT